MASRSPFSHSLGCCWRAPISSHATPQLKTATNTADRRERYRYAPSPPGNALTHRRRGNTHPPPPPPPPRTSFSFSHEATRVLGLGLLSLVSEEFVRPDSPLPDVRKKELRASLVWAMPSILQVLAEVRRRAAAVPLKPSGVCRGFEEMAGESRQKTAF